jgi:hypothetical protein
VKTGTAVNKGAGPAEESVASGAGDNWAEKSQKWCFLPSEDHEA